MSTRMIAYLVVALVIAIGVALSASRQARKWDEMTAPERRARVLALVLLAVVAATGVLVSGYEFKNYLTRERNASAYLSQAN